MTTASFKFSPKILARLGEELNQSADQSILELVKNAYDANAHKCSITLADTLMPGGSITVADDGDGMDVDGIKNGWLVLGRSSKSNANVTRLGRRPAGSKGLGRLAALRMGKRVELESVQRGNSRRIHKLDIDWGAYDHADVVEDVRLDIYSGKHAQGGHGTVTKLLDLRAPLRSDEVKRLARSLVLLTDPFDDDNAAGFKVSLIAPEFKELENLLNLKYFDQASFHLKASIDKNGIATAKILDWQGALLASTDHEGLRRKDAGEIYKSPPAEFDIWIFILKNDEFSARRSSKGEISAWLDAFGGVHIYQDKIRVSPYGNKGDDWLEMNLARVRSPEERPGTHTTIGRIRIPGDCRYPLTQKTDRTGFIEDDYFLDLKTFAQDALNWLARWRLKQAQQRRDKEKEEAPKGAVIEQNKITAAIALAPKAVQKKLTEAFSGYQRSRDKEADNLRREVQLYRTLSTAGITAATFAHETHGNSLKIIDISTNFLLGRIPKTVPDKIERQRLLDPVHKVQKASKSLGTLGSATLSLVKSSKRRASRVSVHDVIRNTVSLLDPFREGRTTEIEEQLDKGNPYLLASEAAIESIIANLVNNSLRAFERDGTAQRKIQLRTEVANETVSIIVADSGPGIKDVDINDIWLPGVTTNTDGTGLGLTIVRDTVKDLGGRIQVGKSEELGGAEFQVHLPILGK